MNGRLSLPADTHTIPADERRGHRARRLIGFLRGLGLGERLSLVRRQVGPNGMQPLRDAGTYPVPSAGSACGSSKNGIGRMNTRDPFFIGVLVAVGVVWVVVLVTHHTPPSAPSPETAVLSAPAAPGPVPSFPPVPAVCHQGALCWGVIGGADPRFTPDKVIGCTSQHNLDALDVITGNQLLTPGEITERTASFFASGRCRYFEPDSFVREVSRDDEGHGVMLVLTGVLAGRTLYTLDPPVAGGGKWCGGCAQ